MPNATTEWNVMQRATEMGVTTWSTPWTPPAQWKSNKVYFLNNKHNKLI